MKVEIQSLSRTTDYNIVEKTKVLVDGVEIGTGRYGGEPEDNCRYRDYDWVEDMLKKLAESLGADVVITVGELGEED